VLPDLVISRSPKNTQSGNGYPLYLCDGLFFNGLPSTMPFPALPDVALWRGVGYDQTMREPVSETYLWQGGEPFHGFNFQPIGYWHCPIARWFLKQVIGQWLSTMPV